MTQIIETAIYSEHSKIILYPPTVFNDSKWTGLEEMRQELKDRMSGVARCCILPLSDGLIIFEYDRLLAPHMFQIITLSE